MNDPAPNPLDPVALERLHRLGGARFVREMIGLFLGYAPQRITDALAAQRLSDWVALRKAIHPLRSGGGQVGARLVQDLAARIEDLARQDAPDQILPLLKQLESALAEATTQLEKERDALSA